MFTLLHQGTEVVCARGCDDLPFGSGTLPPVGEETEAIVVGRSGTFLKGGGYEMTSLLFSEVFERQLILLLQVRRRSSTICRRL